MMAMVDPIRSAMHPHPFRPSTSYLVDGQFYLVRLSDFIVIPMSPRGREDLMVYHADESHFTDMGLIVEVQLPDAQPAPEAGGD
jgi:hypothetical protein